MFVLNDIVMSSTLIIKDVAPSEGELKQMKATYSLEVGSLRIRWIYDYRSLVGNRDSLAAFVYKALTEPGVALYVKEY